jgi:hypothetical protein
VPEVLQDGATGFIVDDMDAAVAAVGRLGELSRRRCREVFEQRFEAGRMARDYVRIYERLCSGRRMPADGRGRTARLPVTPRDTARWRLLTLPGPDGNGRAALPVDGDGRARGGSPHE